MPLVPNTCSQIYYSVGKISKDRFWAQEVPGTVSHRKPVHSTISRPQSTAISQSHATNLNICITPLLSVAQCVWLSCLGLPLRRCCLLLVIHFCLPGFLAELSQSQIHAQVAQVIGLAAAVSVLQPAQLQLPVINWKFLPPPAWLGWAEMTN